MHGARFAVMFLILAGAVFTLHAQTTTKGAIVGSVQDSSDAAVVGATLRLRNSATGAVREVQSDSNGLYAFRGVDPGTYKIEVEAKGFMTLVQPEVQVLTGGESTVKFTLKVGQVSQTIEVKAREDVVNTVDATVSYMVTNEDVQDMPLSEKSAAVLTRLQAGATPLQISTADTSPNTDTGGYINGQRQFFQSVTLDGAYYSDPFWPGGTMTTNEGSGISFDAVREFRVMTGNGQANQMLTGGYSMSLTSRSGTKAFHGSAFEFLRNNVLDARNYFDGPKVPPFRRNQFGGSLGGPLTPSKQGNFFFGSYEGFRQVDIVPFTTVGPTPLLLSLLPSGPSHGYMQEIFSTVFPLPTPGTYGANAAVAPALSSTNLGRNYDSFLIRTDHNLTGKDQLTFRYNFSNGLGQPGTTFAEGTQGGDVGFSWRFQNLLGTWTRSISNNKVNEFHVAYNRVGFDFFGAPTPQSLVALGFKPQSDQVGGLPFIISVGTGLSYVGPLPFAPQNRQENSIEFADNFSWNKGKHLLSLGGQLLYHRADQTFGNNIRPETIFLGLGAPFDTSTSGLTTGNFYYQAQNFYVTPGAIRQPFRMDVFNSYFQDSFRATRNLTLNYGLRWGFNTPMGTATHQLSNAYLSNSSGKPDCGADLSIANISNLVVAPVGGSGGCEMSQFRKTDFAPNVGFAWQLPRTGFVVRSGYGIAYAVPYFEMVGGYGANPPFGVSTLLFGQPFGTTANPVTNAATPGLVGFNPGSKTPYVQYWNLTLERNVGEHLLLRAAYVGNKSTHLWYTAQPNLGSGYTGVRPNPNYGEIQQERSDVNANYNALRLEATRRFARGLSIQTTYSYAKSLDTNSSTITTFSPDIQGTVTNQFNLRSDYGPSDFNIGQSFVANLVYDLPIGPGRRFANVKGVGGKFFGGWQISSIITASSNIPVSILSGIDNNGDGVVNDRAELLPGGSLSNVERRISATQFLNPASVGVDIAASGGVPLGRNDIPGPRIVFMDFSLRKTTNITERVNLAFSAEFFNLLNHANFEDPVNTVSSPVFGQITHTLETSRQIQFGLRLAF